MSKKSISRMYATAAQTKRWVKCLNEWANARGVNSDDLCEMLGFAHRSSWQRLMTGDIRRVKMDVMVKSIQECALNNAYIHGIYDYKSCFSEARNIFMDFRDVYASFASKGQFYQASQIIRKAAVFIFESLVPKDIFINLHMENRRNEYESAKLICSVDETEFFTINIFGDRRCVRFTMSKKVGSAEVPVMEGDLDIHAVAAIKNQLSNRKKLAIEYKKTVDRFSENAKQMSDNQLP